MTSQPPNQLAIPFRKSTHLSYAPGVRQNISSKYDQHPDMFREDIETIDALRRDAVNVREAHSSGIQKLQAYAAQLVWMTGKFPIDIGADFTWYRSLGYNTEQPLVQNNLQYELLNVLYNLAALYCQLAISANSSTDPNAAKTAANYYSHAAGVLTHMKTAVLPKLRMAAPPEDMDEATLESLAQLMLAQSQECFWSKAVTDKYKDATVSKIAARVSDLYNLAAEAAMKSDAISSAWIHHISAKHHHFAGVAQYRASLDCLEKRNYGEEIARLKDAVACANEGLRESRGGHLKDAVIEDLKKLKTRAEEDFKRAEHDNDVIYLKHVPSKAELKILDRANLAVARVPPQVSAPHEHLGDDAEFGPALFSKLVPYAVHIAVSIYEERRDRLVNKNIIQELEVLTETMHEIVSSLNLPGSLQALEKPLGLPGRLMTHREDIIRGLKMIHERFANIDTICAGAKAVLKEGKARLAAEEEEDQRLRRKYGTERWTRPESREDPIGAGLWKEASENDEYFQVSAPEDEKLRQKYNKVHDTLMVLSGPLQALMDYVPSSRRVDIPESVKPALGRLRSAYNDVLRLESKRRRRVEALRDRARSDDINPEMLRETARLERAYPGTSIVPAHFDDFFERRLDSLYEEDLALVEREKAEQEKCLGEVTRVNREFEAQRRAAGLDKGGGREREAALQKLYETHDKYTEIFGYLEAALKFHNGMKQRVELLHKKCDDWVSLRRQEAIGMESELSMPSLASLSLQHHPPPQPQELFQPQETFHQSRQSLYQNHPPPSPPQQPHVSVSTDPSVPTQQPRPVPAQQTWQPHMAIQFGGSSGPADGQAPRNAPQRAENKPVGGTWDPSSGIRFG